MDALARTSLGKDWGSSLKSVAVEDYRIPVITTDQMREVDRLMIEKYDVQLIQMMENAGRNLVELVRSARAFCTRHSQHPPV